MRRAPDRATDFDRLGFSPIPSEWEVAEPQEHDLPEFPEQEFEQANLRLSEGLKSCQAVLSGYRRLLSADQQGAGVAANERHPAVDDAAAGAD